MTVKQRTAALRVLWRRLCTYGAYSLSELNPYDAARG